MQLKNFYYAVKYSESCLEYGIFYIEHCTRILQFRTFYTILLYLNLCTLDANNQICRKNLEEYRLHLQRLDLKTLEPVATSTESPVQTLSEATAPTSPTPVQTARPPEPRSTYNANVYEGLCANRRMPELERPLQVRQRYERCYVANFGNVPRATFDPVRIEVLLDEPPIVLFHGILSQQEINHLKELALPLVCS